MCNNSQVSGPSKAILLLLSLPPTLIFLSFLFFPAMLRVRCTCIGHRIAHTCIPAARNNYTIHSSVPCKEKSALQGTFLFCCLFNLWSRVTLYTLPDYFFFPFCFCFSFCQIASLSWRMGFMMALLISVFEMWRRCAPPDTRRARSAVGAHTISFFFLLLRLPRSCLLVSSQHCSVPLNVLTIKPGERVLYLCSVFAEYENVSMQYQSDELRRVDQRQRRYLGVFSISPC